MIPKKIHYCWVGGAPLTPLAEKCIESWKKCCPDYEIIRWDENNYDFKKNKYMRQAYEQKKWGFVPDYARLDIIYQNGGIYLDTDVELLKSFDELLNDSFFCGVEEQNKNRITVAFGLGFGAEKGHPILRELMQEYEKINFINADGTLNVVASPIYQTDFLTKRGLINTDEIQKIEDITIYPKEYFNPMDLNTGKIVLKEKTISIHHYAGSWLNSKEKIRYEIHKFLNRMIGIKATNLIRKIILRK